MKMHKRQISESAIDKKQIFYHGSAKEKMSKFDAPSFTHPFYVTADPEYALAFATKRHSSTGHDAEGTKIEFAKTDANTYVYIMTLNDKSKFVDIRRYDSNEFKEVLNLLPNGIVQLIEIYADNRKQFKKDKEKTISQYSNDKSKNDVWFLFELVKNTTIAMLKSNPKSKIFSKGLLLDVTRKNVSDYKLQIARTTFRNAISKAYIAFCKDGTPDVRLQKAKDYYGNEHLSEWKSYGCSLLNNTKLSELLNKIANAYANDSKEDLEEYYHYASIAIKLLFVEYKNSKSTSGFSPESMYNVMTSYVVSTYSKILSDSIYDKLDDNIKNDFTVRMQMYNKLTYSVADLTQNTPYEGTKFENKKNAIAEVSEEVLKDSYLSTLTDNITTHQLMGHYFEVLYKKGYIGVITAENDTDSSGNFVETDYAVGIWDKDAIDQIAAVPIRYKFLKKLINSNKSKDMSPIDTIKHYIALYNNILSK